MDRGKPCFRRRSCIVAENQLSEWGMRERLGGRRLDDISLNVKQRETSCYFWL